MSETDDQRLQDAFLAYRRNRRVAARARGEDISGWLDGSRPETPDPACLEGIGATPEELILYLAGRISSQQSLNANLHRAATLGMAVEVSMHEMHSEANAVAGALSYAARNLAQGASADRIEWGSKALARLTATMPANARLGHRDYGRNMTGAGIAAAVEERYGPYLERSRVTMEFTDAFLSSKPKGRENLVVPVFLNLVGNAWLWTEKSGRDRVIRLDAYAVETPPPDPTVDPDDEEEGWMARPGSEDILAIEDSGPGILKGKESDIFRPFSSGRPGGTGIGLYLCRRNLEGWGSTVVLDPAGSPLGGARFLVGPSKVLDPVRLPPLPLMERLTLEAVGIANLHLDGRSSEIVRLHAETHAEICAQALRVRVEGPSDPVDARFLKAADAMSGIMEGRLDAAALEPFEDPSPASAFGL